MFVIFSILQTFPVSSPRAPAADEIAPAAASIPGNARHLYIDSSTRTGSSWLSVYIYKYIYIPVSLFLSFSSSFIAICARMSFCNFCLTEKQNFFRMYVCCNSRRYRKGTIFSTYSSLLVIRSSKVRLQLFPLLVIPCSAQMKFKKKSNPFQLNGNN